MFELIPRRFEVLVKGTCKEFFSLPGARSYARTHKRLAPVIFDLVTRERVSIEPPRRRVRVQEILHYSGKAHHAPRHIAEALFTIRRRASEICGKKMSHPPEAIKQARMEWLEKQI